MKEHVKMIAMKYKNLSEADAEAKAELHLQKIFTAKRAMMNTMGLNASLIDPADDGRWGGGIFISEEQADFIIQNAGRKTDEIHREKRSPGMWWSFWTESRWNQTIPYYFWPVFCK